VTASCRPTPGRTPVATFGDPAFQTYIGTIDDGGTSYAVFCRVSFDGIEFVGRLWFAEPGRAEYGFPDRAPIPERTRDRVLERATRLSSDELRLRHRRAFAERRRYLQLRRLTDEIIEKVRYMNQVAVALDAGHIDDVSAIQEFELTEAQLHDYVDRLRASAGVVG
jgi:hypothetical protein